MGSAGILPLVATVPRLLTDWTHEEIMAMVGG
jgi:hypothetical protein